MSIITKTEICENVPASLPSLSFQALIGDMKRIESLSNDKIMELESRLQAKEDETESLRRRNEELKSHLSAKERDCKLYYDQYQHIAAQFEEFKAKLGKDVEVPKLKEKIEADIEPAIVVFDTDSENENDHDETILFTSPELFLEPPTLEKPIPKANSTELTLKQPEETVKQSPHLSLETAKTKNVSAEETSPVKSAIEKKKRPIAKARKRAMSESHARSGAPPTKIPKILPTPTHFKCKTCPSLAFEEIEEYRQHVKQNHPKVKFFCNFCAFVTVHLGNLKRHEDVVHTHFPNKGHECKLCNVSYSKRSALAIHIKMFH